MSLQHALYGSKIGSPLEITSRPIPVPKPNQVLVKVSSAGLNPFDAKVRDTGLYRNGGAPGILANDVAGIITVLSADVTDFKVGDHVFGQSNFRDASMDCGGLQQFSLLDAPSSARVPKGYSADQAATIPTNAIAAYVALFDDTGLGLPAPTTHASAKFPYSEKSIVIIGGGSNCGKFGVQLASFVGFGRIVVVAGKANEAELTKFGATHVIDRHSTPVEIKTRVREVLGDEVVYVFHTISTDYTLAASLLSDSKEGRVVGLLPSSLSKEELAKKDIGKKEAGFSIVQIFGSSHMRHTTTELFWKSIESWVEDGHVKTLDFKVVEGGLNPDAVNKILDGYTKGKSDGKWHVHPNE